MNPIRVISDEERELSQELDAPLAIPDVPYESVFGTPTDPS